MEAISHAGAAVGILAKDGVVLVAEKRITSKLLETSRTMEKMYKIDDHISMAVAGITADANILVNYSRLSAQRHTLAFSEPVPVEQLIQTVCDLKQGYTQYGGLRPFGVSFVWAGWDVHYGFQLYQSDPSGNYGGWKATSIGANSQSAQSMLKQEYKEDCDVDQALHLAIKVLSKNMDSTSLSADKLEITTLTRPNDKVEAKNLKKDEIEALVDVVNKEIEEASKES